MWHLVTWFSDECSGGLTAGLDDLGGIVQR